MSKPIIQIHNVETGEISQREMNDTEYKQHLKDVEDSLARQAEAEAKAQAKAELLAKLGITQEEANLLIS